MSGNRMPALLRRTIKSVESYKMWYSILCNDNGDISWEAWLANVLEINLQLRTIWSTI